MKETKRILIVEDDFDFANDLKFHLENHDYMLDVDVRHVATFEEAKEILPTFQPHAISLDIQLTDGFGTHLIHYIYSNQSPLNYIPFIIVISSSLNDFILDFIRQHKILYYLKSDPYFKIRYAADSFLIHGNTTIPSTFKESLDNTASLPHSNSELPTGDTLREIIEQKISIYPFNHKSVAFNRLVDGVYYTLLHDCSLSHIFNEIIDVVDYNTAYKGISRLLITVFGTENKLTPDAFIQKIVSEIRNDYV